MRLETCCLEIAGTLQALGSVKITQWVPTVLGGGEMWGDVQFEWTFHFVSRHT